MNDTAVYLLPASTPLLFAVLALVMLKRPSRWPKAAAALPLVAALASTALLLTAGPGQSPLLGIVGIGLSIRLDALSATLLLLISFLGFTILHYSRQYLEGDARHGVFMRDLALTLAAVSALVTAGNLYMMIGAWIGMSLLLNRLLIFRAERPAARLAARKKFILARAGDASLLVAFGILIAAFGTADISELLTLAQSGDNHSALAVAAGLVAFTAVLKSAQFPTHGWLVEVMETPTPVSALLHAGIVNAGGFLFLRFSDFMTAVPGVSLSVAALGGLTAIIGSAIMLSQTNIKSALAYSTVGQMGFMMLQCGLGAYSAAMVHLVGHSLYKAHAFLSSGDAVRRLSAEGWRRGVAATNLTSGLFKLALVGALYALIAQLSGYRWPEDGIIIGLGGVLMLGIWLYLDAPNMGAKPRVTLYVTAAATAVSYFLIQTAAATLYGGLFAAPPVPGVVAFTLMGAVLVASLAIVLAQGRDPASARWHSLRVHLAQGLYLNIILNRWLGGFRTRQANTR